MEHFHIAASARPIGLDATDVAIGSGNHGYLVAVAGKMFGKFAGQPRRGRNIRRVKLIEECHSHSDV